MLFNIGVTLQSKFKEGYHAEVLERLDASHCHVGGSYRVSVVYVLILFDSLFDFHHVAADVLQGFSSWPEDKTVAFVVIVDSDIRFFGCIFFVIPF